MREGKMEEFGIERIVRNILQQKMLLILIVLIAILVGCIYSFFIQRPLYKASSKILLAKNDLSASELIKSDMLLNEVIAKINNVEITLQELKDTIDVSYTKESKMLQITYVNADRELTNTVMTEIINQYMTKLEDVMNIRESNLIEQVNASANPYNIDHIKTIGTALILGIITCIVYISIITITNTQIKVKQEIENIGIKVLGVVPESKKEGN